MREPDDDKTRTHVTLTAGTMVSHYRFVEAIFTSGTGCVSTWMRENKICREERSVA